MTDSKDQKEYLSLKAASLLLASLFVAWLFLLGWPNISYGQLYNTTYLVNTTVNITNAAPVITYIAFDQTINLNSYNNKTVSCNVSVFDYDNNTVNVVGIIFLNGSTLPNNTDDYNNKYTNNNCTRTSGQDLSMNYSCLFRVQYFADNSTKWICNATASDSHLINNSNLSNLGTVNPLVAIKMDDVLDYGQLEVGMTSNDTVANITNAGNRDANISVSGYAATPGDNLAFICSYGTIALNYEKYSRLNGTSYLTMTTLTTADVNLTNFHVKQRTNDTKESINNTYWKIYIPSGAGGICNGKILFTASDRGN